MYPYDKLFASADGVTSNIQRGHAIHAAFEKLYRGRRYTGRICVSEELRKLLRKDGFAVTKHSAWTPSGRRLTESELRQLGVFLETALMQEDHVGSAEDRSEEDFYAEHAKKSWLSLGSLIGDIIRSAP